MCLHFSATASSGKESSDDLEELEKAKAALEAQLAAANISDEGLFTFSQLFESQWARKIKKVQAKKTREIKEIKFRNTFF